MTEEKKLHNGVKKQIDSGDKGWAKLTGKWECTTERAVMIGGCWWPFSQMAEDQNGDFYIKQWLMDKAAGSLVEKSEQTAANGKR